MILRYRREQGIIQYLELLYIAFSYIDADFYHLGFTTTKLAPILRKIDGNQKAELFTMIKHFSVFKRLFWC